MSEEPEDFDLLDRAQMAAVDPNRELEGRPIPALTSLMYLVCGNDEGKFSQALDLIRLIQEKTIELKDREE